MKWLGYAPWVLLACAVALLVYQTLTLDTSRAKVETLETKLSEETGRADRNAEEIDRLAAITASNEALTSEVRSLRSTLDRRANAIIETITNAPPESDGPVAPVLRDALNSLRDTAAAD